MFYGGEDDEHDFMPSSSGGCVSCLICKSECCVLRCHMIIADDGTRPLNWTLLLLLLGFRTTSLLRSIVPYVGVVGLGLVWLAIRIGLALAF